MSHQTTAPLPHKGQSSSPTLGVGDIIAEGDTSLVENLLAPELAESALERLKEEVQWETMHHRGKHSQLLLYQPLSNVLITGGEVPRRVAVQGAIEADGSIPLYRHPADKSPSLRPFTPTVALIAQRVSAHLQHPVNHVLIQHYRSGADYISEHSDKTIDVVRDSSIVNVSLGAQRTMFLRTKRDAGPKQAQRVPLPDNSMFVLGLKSNRIWVHGIHTDNRPERIKDSKERGERISLTFRWIGTFLTSDSKQIWGQGATGKTREEAKPVVNGEKEAVPLIEAFGHENRNSTFDWDAAYGDGYDVLHFNT